MKPLAHLILSAAIIGAAISLPITPVHAGNVSVGVSVGVHLPHGAVRVKVGREHYHYHHGVYYRRTPRGYVVVRAPHGARVRVLPRSHVRVVIGGRTYYRDADVYYRVVPGGYYEVCEAPVIVTESVEAPPPAAASQNSASTPMQPAADASSFVQCTRGQERYFLRSGMFFRKTGSDYVLVAEPPIGAMAEHLPDDSVSVMLDGKEYFRSGDVLFELTRDGFMVSGNA